MSWFPRMEKSDTRARGLNHSWVEARSNKIQHAVQRIDGNRHFGRATPVRAGAQPGAEHPLEAADVVLVFVRNRNLEPTNSGSERALKPCAVRRKITDGLRQGWGAHLCADIRSGIETA